MGEFEILKNEVERGISGLNSGISMGFERLNKYISIRKSIYTIIMAGTGLGKSALLHNAYILNPYDYLLSRKENKIKYKVILFSMERSKLHTVAKWLSRKIFLDHGMLIPVAKLLGWWDQKLTYNEHDYFLAYEDYIDEMFDSKSIEIIENGQNPTGIYKYVKDYALSHGRVEEIDEFNKIYIPNNENEIVTIGVDHASLIRKEKGLMNKKEAIDKLSEYLQFFRDFYGYSPVLVMQNNRSMADSMLLKSGDAEPTLEHAADSSTPIQDSDCVLSLYDPKRYRQADPSGYDLEKFIDTKTGAYYYRSLKILKSTYSESDVRIALGFQGITGNFKEMPKIKEMDQFNYNTLFDGTFFLPS